MMLTAARMRQIGWGALLALCILFFTILSLTVHAVQNEVVLAERRIIALKQETLMLETEFESRANQRQLANWNRVEFGYQAPRADQYVDNRRQLAALGQPQGPKAPRPLRVARTELASLEGQATKAAPRDMVSPVSGARIAQVSTALDQDALTGFSEAFEGFLIERGRAASPAPRSAAQPAPAGGSILSDSRLVARSRAGLDRRAVNQAGNGAE